MTYARDTSVSTEKSRAELQALLRRHGAGQFMSADDFEHGASIIGWTLEGRQVRISVPLPDPKSDEVKHRWTAHGYAEKERPLPKQREVWEQLCRSRWRAVLLIVKAKLEAIEIGISTVEREFLADVVLPNGRTVGEFVAPQLAEVYSSGKMPALLPGIGGTAR